MVGVYTNYQKDGDLSVTDAVTAALTKNGFSWRAVEGGEFSELELLVTVGGDGTILKVSEACAKADIPILPVNMGHLGFLTEVQPNDIASAISKYKDGKYTLDRRELISVKFAERECLALNDVAIIGNNNRLVDIRVKADGELLDEFSCDGYIICTPTGSTAYSLSAGGSVISPKAPVLGLTPINAHTLHARPLIVPSSECIEVTNICDKPMSVIVDGENMGSLCKDGSVCVTGSSSVSFVRFDKISFYHRLLSKLFIIGN